jgi:periplasmic protein TonB
MADSSNQCLERRPARWIGALMLGALALAPIGALAATEAAPPKPVKHDPPDYPRGAVARGIEGAVLIEFNIDRQGNVVAPHVILASPPGVFDAAALEALSKWKYEASGKITSNVKVNITFKQR